MKSVEPQGQEPYYGQNEYQNTVSGSIVLLRRIYLRNNFFGGDIIKVDMSMLSSYYYCSTPLKTCI